MFFKIHRGTKEIGGSCVEVWTDNTRIVIDFGMPLVDKDGKDFDFNKYQSLSVSELIGLGVLPDIKGLYSDESRLVDGIVISHAHQDHYGFIRFIHKNCACFMGEATHKIIELSNLFAPDKLTIKNCVYFQKETPFRIGDFTITPYWADHSAFDAYSFLVEANGKSLFYSGDFRAHGRKAKVFKWFTHNAPKDVDCLLLEGTSVGRSSHNFQSEKEIEEKLIELFNEQGKINLIYTSGQNIDRLVSVYKACIRTNKIMAVDVYVAIVLKELSKFAEIPYPSKKYPDIKVIFPQYVSQNLTQQGKENMLYQFRSKKITKGEISKKPEDYVILVRPSLKEYLDGIANLTGGNFIYSLWEGYLSKGATKDFVDYLTALNFTLHKVHTSGHADISTLQQMVNAINPKYIFPIHTFRGEDYQKLFSQPVIRPKDGEVIMIVEN